MDRLNLLLSIADHSQQKLNFNTIKIFTGCDIHAAPQMDNVDLISVGIHSVEQYNNFVLKRLHSYICSEHCLIYQHDGFIHNPGNWDDTFLQYDYIGAVWPKKWWCPHNRVGNGGFSLRSKKLLSYFTAKEIDTSRNEDLYICVDQYANMLADGINFAPPGVACRFSLEENTEFNCNINKTFGFHGSAAREHLYSRTIKMQQELLNICDETQKKNSHMRLTR